MKLKYIACSFVLLLALSSCNKKQEKYEKRDVKIDTVFDSSSSKEEISNKYNNENYSNGEMNNEEIIGEKQADGEVYKTKTTLNLRETPNTNEDNFITSIPENAELVVKEKVNDDGISWYKVSYNGREGYVSSDYLIKVN